LKKLILASTILIMLFMVIEFSPAISNNQSLADLTCDSSTGVVDKTQGAAFTVQITFKNTGKTGGEWTINIAFEGDKWTWTGTPQDLQLSPSSNKTPTWSGTVPENAPIDSIARLVVYYDNSFKALDWWIHVVPNAQLTITSSIVK
jgi:hypothetical protein